MLWIVGEQKISKGENKETETDEERKKRGNSKRACDWWMSSCEPAEAKELTKPGLFENSSLQKNIP